MLVLSLLVDSLPDNQMVRPAAVPLPSPEALQPQILDTLKRLTLNSKP